MAVMLLLLHDESDFKGMIAMEKILIKNKEYIFIKDFKDNSSLRKSYNELTNRTYGFDFEQWYEGGYWGNSYIPYSLMDGDNIVANVSASIIDFFVLEEDKRYMQIGTVMTDPAYRNQGLARYLMERVIEEWKSNCDMIYLFANDSVLDFYPKFGFEPASEHQYYKTITCNNEDITAEKLDMSSHYNRKLLEEKVANSIPISKLSMIKNVGLIMFYCTYFMSDAVYYIRKQDAILIGEFKDDTLYLYDIFSSSEIDLDNAIKSIGNKEIKTVALGFTPRCLDGYSLKSLKEDNTTLFIMKDKPSLFKDDKLMFPVLSHT